jgi:hypothetical protein
MVSQRRRRARIRLQSHQLRTPFLFLQRWCCRHRRPADHYEHRGPSERGGCSGSDLDEPGPLFEESIGGREGAEEGGEGERKSKKKQARVGGCVCIWQSWILMYHYLEKVSDTVCGHKLQMAGRRKTGRFVRFPSRDYTVTLPCLCFLPWLSPFRRLLLLSVRTQGSTSFSFPLCSGSIGSEWKSYKSRRKGMDTALRYNRYVEEERL